MEEFIKKASVLVEAIPYIHAFRKKIIVIKYGGSILEDASIRKRVLKDIVFLNLVGIRIILVHGGGSSISHRLKESGFKSEFHDGLRVTDEPTLQIVKEELNKLNERIVQEIAEFKGEVVGLKGEDKIIFVEKKKASRDLGFVGTINSIDTKILEEQLKKESIIVISPMGVNAKKQPHNVNADEVASAIAVALRAEKLVLLTNVLGVLRNTNDPQSLISTLTDEKIETLIQDNIIQSGMIPKVKACLDALQGDVMKTHILDAKIPHALLLEFFTDQGVGTQIIKTEDEKVRTSSGV